MESEQSEKPPPSGGIKDHISRINKTDGKQQVEEAKNPFSESYQVQKHEKGSSTYGRPIPGSKTERRGIAASVYVGREIVFLCEIISKFGTVPPPTSDSPGAVVEITFGKLFDVYAYYSDKIIELCEVIQLYGTHKKQENDAAIWCTFGSLFKAYVAISNKVVGMLLRARRYGLVSFEGEMLYQRQDDHKIITLLKPLSEIRTQMASSNDPAKCLSPATSS